MPEVIAPVTVTVHHLCIIHQSAATLNQLTAEVNNTDHPANVQSGCHLSPPLHLLHGCRPNRPPARKMSALSAALKASFVGEPQWEEFLPGGLGSSR